MREDDEIYSVIEFEVRRSNSFSVRAKIRFGGWMASRLRETRQHPTHRRPSFAGMRGSVTVFLEPLLLVVEG